MMHTCRLRPRLRKGPPRWLPLTLQPVNSSFIPSLKSSLPWILSLQELHPLTNSPSNRAGSWCITVGGCAVLIIHHPSQLWWTPRIEKPSQLLFWHVEPCVQRGVLVICDDLWSSRIAKVAQFRIETVLGHAEHWVGFKNPTQCWERKIFKMLIGMKHISSFDPPTLTHLIIWSRSIHQNTNFFCDADLKLSKLFQTAFHVS